MSSEFEGLAETQAKLYFQDYRYWIRGLYDTLRGITTAFSTLQKEYDALLPRCKLRLYSHCRPGYGPVALNWGLIITLHPSRFPRYHPSGKQVKVPRYLKRPFDPRWVYQFAKRSDQVDRFLDFDRRALALNDVSKAVFRALRHLKTSTAVQFSSHVSSGFVPSGLDPVAERRVPGIPVDPQVLDLPAEFRQYLRSGWLACFSLALAEEESYKLSREVSVNPSAEGIRLELFDRNEPRLVRHVGWVHTQSETFYPSLSHKLMKRLHVREAVRPVLSQKEIKRRRIAKALVQAATALDLVHEKCRAAELALATGLAEARMIFLRPPNSAPAPALPVAG